MAVITNMRSKVKARNADTPKVKAMLETATPRAEAFFRQLNSHLTGIGEAPLDLSNAGQEFQENLVEVYTSNAKVKAVLDASTAALGSGIDAEEWATQGEILMYPGRGFEMAGVNVRRNQKRNFTPFGATSSRFSGFVTGTPAAGDQSPTMKDHTVTLDRYNASIAITKLLGEASLVDVYTKFEMLLENKKELKLDELLAEYITTAGNGADQFPIPSTTHGKITQAAVNMQAELSGFGIPAYFTTAAGLSQWMSERDANGKPLMIDGLQLMVTQGIEIPRVGRVGYFGSSPVYINNGIKDAGSGSEGYIVTAGTNAISAQTGGTHTALVAGLVGQAEIGRGTNKEDAIRLFGTQNGGRTEFFSDNDEIGATFMAGAAMANDDAWKVFAI